MNSLFNYFRENPSGNNEAFEKDKMERPGIPNSTPIQSRLTLSAYQ